MVKRQPKKTEKSPKKSDKSPKKQPEQSVEVKRKEASNKRAERAARRSASSGPSSQEDEEKENNQNMRFDIFRPLVLVFISAENVACNHQAVPLAKVPRQLAEVAESRHRMSK